MAGLELPDDKLRCTGQHASLVLHRLGLQHVAAGARHAIGQELAQALTLDTKHFLDLANLADEESAMFLRQEDQPETGMLIAGSHARPDGSPFADMDAL